MWSLVGMSVHVLIKDSDSLVWGVVGVVTCGRVSACPDQGLGLSGMGSGGCGHLWRVSACPDQGLLTLWYGEWWVWPLVGMSVHVLIKDSDSLVWGVVGVVTCGRVSACPDQGL